MQKNSYGEMSPTPLKHKKEDQFLSGFLKTWIQQSIWVKQQSQDLTKRSPKRFSSKNTFMNIIAAMWYTFLEERAENQGIVFKEGSRIKIKILIQFMKFLLGRLLKVDPNDQNPDNENQDGISGVDGTRFPTITMDELNFYMDNNWSESVSDQNSIPYKMSNRGDESHRNRDNIPQFVNSSPLGSPLRKNQKSESSNILRNSDSDQSESDKESEESSESDDDEQNDKKRQVRNKTGDEIAFNDDSDQEENKTFPLKFDAKFEKLYKNSINLTEKCQVFDINGLLELDQQINLERNTKIGEGAQGSVYSVKITNAPTNGTFATKIKLFLDNDKLAEQAIYQMFKEFTISKDLDHPNIVRYQYFMREYNANTKEHEIQNIIQLISGPDMTKYFKKHTKAFSIANVRSIGQQLISAIECLHKQNIIHQDIKPANIVFESNMQDIKLIDMGISNKIRGEVTIPDREMAGTKRYMSPEQFRGTFTLKIDIWAFACVLLKYATGISPYDGCNEVELLITITEKKISPLEHLQSNFKKVYDSMHKSLIELLTTCFDFNYETRPDASEVLSHPFFNKEDKASTKQLKLNFPVILPKFIKRENGEEKLSLYEACKIIESIKIKLQKENKIKLEKQRKRAMRLKKRKERQSQKKEANLQLPKLKGGRKSPFYSQNNQNNNKDENSDQSQSEDNDDVQQSERPGKKEKAADKQPGLKLQLMGKEGSSKSSMVKQSVRFQENGNSSSNETQIEGKDPKQQKRDNKGKLDGIHLIEKELNSMIDPLYEVQKKWVTEITEDDAKCFEINAKTIQQLQSTMETAMLFEFKTMEQVQLLSCADIQKFIGQFNHYNTREFKFKEILDLIETKGIKPVPKTEEEAQKQADEERKAKYAKKVEIDQTQVVIQPGHMVKPIFNVGGEFMGLQLRPELAKPCYLQTKYKFTNVEKSMKLCSYVNRMMRDFEDYQFYVEQIKNEEVPVPKEYANARCGSNVKVDNDTSLLTIFKNHAKEMFSRTKPERKRPGGYYDQIWDEEFTLHKLFQEEVFGVFSTQDDLEEELEIVRIQEEIEAEKAEKERLRLVELARVEKELKEEKELMKGSMGGKVVSEEGTEEEEVTDYDDEVSEEEEDEDYGSQTFKKKKKIKQGDDSIDQRSHQISGNSEAESADSEAVQDIDSEEEASKRNKKTPAQPMKYMQFPEYISEVFRLLNYKLAVMNLTPGEREMLVLEKLIFAEYNPNPIKKISCGTQTLRVEFKEKNQEQSTHNGKNKLENAYQVAECEVLGLGSAFYKGSKQGQTAANKNIIKLVNDQITLDLRLQEQLSESMEIFDMMVYNKSIHKTRLQHNFQTEQNYETPFEKKVQKIKIDQKNYAEQELSIEDIAAVNSLLTREEITVKQALMKHHMAKFREKLRSVVEEIKVKGLVDNIKDELIDVLKIQEVPILDKDLIKKTEFKKLEQDLFQQMVPFENGRSHFRFYRGYKNDKDFQAAPLPKIDHTFDSKLFSATISYDTKRRDNLQRIKERQEKERCLKPIPSINSPALFKIQQENLIPGQIAQIQKEFIPHVSTKLKLRINKGMNPLMSQSYDMSSNNQNTNYETQMSVRELLNRTQQMSPRSKRRHEKLYQSWGQDVSQTNQNEGATLSDLQTRYDYMSKKERKTDMQQTIQSNKEFEWFNQDLDNNWKNLKGNPIPKGQTNAQWYGVQKQKKSKEKKISGMNNTKYLNDELKEISQKIKGKPFQEHSHQTLNNDLTTNESFVNNYSQSIMNSQTMQSVSMMNRQMNPSLSFINLDQKKPMHIMSQKIILIQKNSHQNSPSKQTLKKTHESIQNSENSSKLEKREARNKKSENKKQEQEQQASSGKRRQILNKKQSNSNLPNIKSQNIINPQNYNNLDIPSGFEQISSPKNAIIAAKRSKKYQDIIQQSNYRKISVEAQSEKSQQLGFNQFQTINIDDSVEETTQGDAFN